MYTLSAMKRNNYFALTLNLILVAIVVVAVVPLVKSLQTMVDSMAATQARYNEAVQDILKNGRTP